MKWIFNDISGSCVGSNQYCYTRQCCYLALFLLGTIPTWHYSYSALFLLSTIPTWHYSYSAIFETLSHALMEHIELKWVNSTIPTWHCSYFALLLFGTYNSSIFLTLPDHRSDQQASILVPVSGTPFGELPRRDPCNQGVRIWRHSPHCYCQSKNIESVILHLLLIWLL